MTRNIFIPGGASGIGFATAWLFMTRGWRGGMSDVADFPEADGIETFKLVLRDRASDLPS